MAKILFRCSLLVTFLVFGLTADAYGITEIPATPYYSAYNITFTDVTLDHFRFQSNTTFPLRYVYNLQSAEVGSSKNTPLFVLVGCEATITTFFEAAGFVSTTLRKQFGAAVLGVEHRYFGASTPFGDQSFTEDHIPYLTVEQALADYVEVIQMFKNAHGLQDSPVVTFGGSYCGLLSSYMRMRYPWLVDGAIASAAPYRGFVGTDEPYAYFQALTEDYRNYNPQCETVLRTGIQSLKNFFALTPGEFTDVSQQLNLCKPLSKALEVSDMYGWISSALLSLALFDYPYKLEMPANPLNVACERAMASESTTSLPSGANSRFLSDDGLQNNVDNVKPVLDAVNVFYNRTETNTCNDIYSLDEFGSLDTTAWAYISGTSFLLDITTNGVTDMFWDLPLDLKPRKELLEKKLGFPITQRPDWLPNNFGGRNYKEELKNYSNIVFSNGSIDPTKTLSITENISDTVLGFEMEGAAHGLDILLPNPADPASVVKGREIEAENIAKWIAKSD